VPTKDTEGIARILTTRRIEALADGIFAFAMTLLVTILGITGSTSGASSGETPITNLLLGQWRMFYHYALSFALLAVFWIYHHRQYHDIERTDGIHIWINIFILMFVALMPFSTDLVVDYSDEPIVECFFGANLMVLGLLFLANWIYASKRGLMKHGLPPYVYTINVRRLAVIPAVSLVAMATAFITPNWGLSVYIAIPIIISLPWFRRW
jgi:uncharacterized membrane protein